MLTSTSDNTELFAWPIDVREGRVAPTRGYLVETTFGGHRIGDRGFTIRGPVDLHLPKPAKLDPELLDACYRVFAGEFDRVDAALGNRMAVATSWLAKAWRNTPQLTAEDRIVFLKTALEALTGESSGPAGATALRSIFEQLTAAGVRQAELGPWLDSSGLLWRRGEPERLRTYQGKGGTYQKHHTTLQHWFMSLAQTRNDIIHAGHTRSFEYRSKSRYRGSYFFTASRLLREALKVELRRFGFSNLWKSPLARRIERRFRTAGVISSSAK